MDIKSHQSDSAFDRFLQRILDKNNFEMNSVTEATRYVAYKDRRDFLPLLKMKYAQLENIPKDSTWKVLIAENYWREYNLSGSPTVLVNLKKTIEKFEKYPNR